MTCSRFSLGSGLLKGAACSLGLAALWLFPAVGRAQPQPCIDTHPSLELGCIQKGEFRRKVQEWRRQYRAVPGFANQWGLRTIRADRAYAHLKAVKGKHVKPGQGVTIGFLDSGIYVDHPSFVNSKVTVKVVSGNKVPTSGSGSGHGTSVAITAAGGRISDNEAPHGVAYGADIVMFDRPLIKDHLSLSQSEYNPQYFRELAKIDDKHSKHFTLMLNEDIDILNISQNFMLRGIVEDYNVGHVKQDFRKTIAALAQADAEEKTILVFSAGNSGVGYRNCSLEEVGGNPDRCVNIDEDGFGKINASSPHLFPGLPALIPELRGHSVAVVATKQDGVIADFSNRCGIAANWCIAAPGQDIRSAYHFGPAKDGVVEWGLWSGTSFSAPMVSGGLAVMKQLFRGQLSNTELVSRLFATANKKGIYANRAVYGQGLMNLGAATNPWGIPAFRETGRSVGQRAQVEVTQPENPPAQSCINTHASLGLGCLTKEELNVKVQEWSSGYRAVPGFANQWGLRAIGVDRAYAHLKAVKGEDVKPGEGVTIGFIDTGIDEDHPSFADIQVTETLLQGAQDESGVAGSHGTAVASVAVGGPISSGVHQSMAHHGVAWGADVAMFAIPLGGYPEFYQTLSLEGLNARDDHDSKLFKHALSKDIDILNLSYSILANIEDYSENQLRNNYSRTIAAFAQADAEEKVIIVGSAGNFNGSGNFHGSKCRQSEVDRCINVNQDGIGGVNASSPQIMSGLPARIPELRGHHIAAVAVKEDGVIANFSNRCGIAADWCIAAPGQQIRTAHFGPSNGKNGAREYWGSHGTSFAAPMVGGGLAVMKQLFRGQLSNTELVSRLFATARKTGIYADRTIYGQGLMDLGAATNPWGIPAFMGTGQAVGAQGGNDSVGQQGGGGVELSRTSLSLGPAMGDGLSHALARQEVAAFDSLGAPFWFPADSFTLPAEGPSLAARLRQFLAPAVERAVPESWQVDFQADAPALEAGHLALTHGADRLRFHGPQGLSTTLFQRPADYDQSPLAGLAVSWNPQTLPALSLTAGYLHEQEELLGSQGSGAFGELSGHTLFLGAELDTTTPQGWELSAQGEVGMVNPAVARSQFISDISGLGTSAFRLQARKPLDNGAAFRLALSQPLRVESGAVSLSLPTGRTKEGRVVGTDLSAPLSPSGRQLDLTAQVDLPLLGGELSLAATHSRQTQHQQGAEGQWTFFTGYRATW